MRQLLLPLFLFCQLTVSAQLTPPTVPAQLDFAGIMVHFDAGAQQLIQQDVNALLSNRKFWEAKLDRAVLYFPIMEAALLDEDVPTDFKYLAVQESSLTPDAVSTSTAVGYWQFKRETAQDQGMRVDDDIDERKSISASTHGAARYLKKNNATFNNWVSSLFSYYLGAGGISKLIPADWSYSHEITLDSRTDRYVLRFFAHKIAVENGLLAYKTGNTFSLIEYPKANGRSIRELSGDLGIDEFELRKYNRWILGDAVPTDKDYTLILPVANNQINDVRDRLAAAARTTKKVPDFVQDDVGFPVLRRISTGMINRSEPVLYEINGLPGIQAQIGDNAGSLAKKAKISFSSLLRYNDMGDRDPIVVNEVYYLAKKRKKALVPYHNVREGETSRSISQRYGLRLKKLLRYNRLDRVQKLQVGRVMWLRERRPSDRPVEIIKSTIPNVIDRTPTRPAVARGNSATTSAGMVSQQTSNGSIPRDASERKLYQPKLVPTQTVSTEQPQTGAAKLDPPKPSSTAKTGDWSLAAPTGTAGTTTAAPTTMAPAPVVTTTTVPDDNGTQRTIIVRSDENPQGSALAAKTAGRLPATTNPVKTARPVDKSRPDAIDETVDGPHPTKPLATGGFEELPTTATTKATTTKITSTTTVTTMPTTTSTGLMPAKTPAVDRPKTTTPVATAPPISQPAKSAAEPKPVLQATKSMAEPKVVASRSAGIATHTVEVGQTYYSIAKSYGVSVDDLLAANKLTTENKLAVGQSLNLPNAKTVARKAITPTVAGRPAATTTHTVKKGENMYRISKQYNVSVEQILEWNQLTDATLSEGQKLKIVQK